MTCGELRTRLHPYVDGELPAGDAAAAEAHAAACPRCAALVRSERELRQLLRRHPREAPSPELRARLVRRLRREARRARLRPWLIAPAAAAAGLLVGLLLASRPAPPLIAELVDKHIAYAEIARPAEFASSDPAAVARWFLERAGLRVTVPDYSPSGIQLVGGRLAEAHRRPAAYLLYEKGRTLLSVFVVPLGDRDPALPGARMSHRGQAYRAYEEKGYRTVAWTEGHTLFGLVSTLDYPALLECADRLRTERASLTPL